MHREIQIKQFPIVTTHWWPKTRNERFVWENEQYLYRFLPLVHNHVQVIWVHTHIRCVTCVCARSGSRCIHTGRRRQRLTEGVSEAWCWRAVIVTTTNHILLWCCMNGIGYLMSPLALEKLKSFRLLPRAAPVKRRDGPTIQFGNAWRHSIQSQREALTPTPRVNGALVCASAGSDLSRVYVTHCQSARTHVTHTHTHTRHTPYVCALRSLGHGCVQEVKNDINTVRFLTQTARFVS